MTSLLIIGAGSFSTEVDELAKLIGYTDIAFLDDKSPVAIGYAGYWQNAKAL